MYYINTYDPETYCPDRRQALILARELNDGDTLVRAMISYAFFVLANRLSYYEKGYPY